jgi:putative membrane protein
MILFWGLIIYGLLHFFRGAPASHRHSDATEILKERYAKGEITKEQFEEIKKDLHK